MSEIEEKLMVEFTVNTPYLIVSSSEMSVGRQTLINCGERSKKALIFWNKKDGFYHMISNDTKYTSVDEIILSSLNETPLELETLVEIPKRYKKFAERSRKGRIPTFDEIAADDDFGEPTEDTDTVNKLKSERDEDHILQWWVRTASQNLCNVTLVMEGNFKLDADLIVEMEQSPTKTPLILLTTNKPEELYGGDEDFLGESSSWIYCTNITPIFLAAPDVRMFRDVLCQTLTEHKVQFPSEDILTTASRALVGVPTLRQAKNLCSRIIAMNKQFGKNEIQELYAMMREKMMESYNEVLTPVHFDVDEVQLGGLDLLKKWINQRKQLYSPDAKEYGLHPPKGVVLCGPPGTGKSVCAKYIAYLLDRPLICFNVELAFKRHVGESEELLKRTFDYLDSLGEVVVLLDEIEKNLGETYNTHESTRRMMAGFLTWQGNRNSKVFVVAASNSLSAIPPEFTRAGRFDKIYYIDLPGIEERIEILRLHLKMRNHGDDFGEKDLRFFAENTGGFSGAELEAVVKDALLASYLRDKHLTTADMMSAIKNTKPLSLSRQEEIRQQRMMAKELASPASSCSYESEVNSAKIVGDVDEEVNICYG